MTVPMVARSYSRYARYFPAFSMLNFISHFAMKNLIEITISRTWHTSDFEVFNSSTTMISYALEKS